MSARKVFVTDFAQNRVHERKMLFSHDILHKDCKRKSPQVKNILPSAIQYDWMELVPLSVLARHPQSFKQKKSIFQCERQKDKKANHKTGVTRKQSTQIFRKTNITYPVTCTRACRMYVKPNISNRPKLLKNFLKLHLFGQGTIVSRL